MRVPVPEETRYLAVNVLEPAVSPGTQNAAPTRVLVPEACPLMLTALLSAAATEDAPLTARPMYVLAFAVLLLNAVLRNTKAAVPVVDIKGKRVVVDPPVLVDAEEKREDLGPDGN